jgi:hypothetical protein
MCWYRKPSTAKQLKEGVISDESKSSLIYRRGSSNVNGASHGHSGLRVLIGQKYIVLYLTGVPKWDRVRKCPHVIFNFLSKPFSSTSFKRHFKTLPYELGLGF